MAHTIHYFKIFHRFQYFVIFLTGWLGIVHSYAQNTVKPTFELKSTTFSEVNLNPYLEVLQDTTHQLSLMEIKTQYSPQFVKLLDHSQPLNSQHTYWLRFRVKNTLAQYAQIFIKLGVNDSMQVFSQGVRPSQKVNSQVTGILIPIAQKPLPHSSWYDQVVSLQLAPHQTQTIYYQIKNLPSQAIQPLATLLSTQSWEAHVTNLYLTQGIFQGVLGIIFIIGLVLFFTTRKKLYLFYFLQILGFSFTFLPNYGLLNNLVVNDFHNYLIWFWAGNLSSIFYILFIGEALQIRTISSRLNLILIFLIISRILALLIGNLILIQSLNYTLVSTINYVLDLSTIALGTIVIIYVFRHKNSFTRFLLLGTSTLLLGLLLTTLASQGIISGIVPGYLFQLGVLIQYIIFSIGLGQRIQENFRKEKAAQAQILEMEKNAKQELEHKVIERTRELSEANNEIITQNEELHQQQEEIIAQRDFIENKNRELGQVNLRLQNSIRVAKNIQQAILPFQRELDYFFEEHFMVYLPKDVVSGDFYWVGEVTKQGTSKTFLAVVDCTGHGVPGAFMALIGHMLLEKIIYQLHITAPAQILEKLNEEVQRVLRQQEMHNDSGMDMVVLCLEKASEHATQITFAGAKNPLLYLPANTSQMQILKGTRKSVGGKFQTDIAFESETITLASGSQIYLGSDGLSDQNNVKRRKFGQKRLIQVLEENQHHTLKAQKKALLDALQTFKLNTDQRDDILWMGIKL